MGRVNSIGGFVVDKVQADVMRSALIRHEVPADRVDPTLETAEQLAVALTIYFRETVSEDDLCKCERCGGEGPATDESCPFCGLVASVDESKPEPKKKSETVIEMPSNEGAVHDTDPTNVESLAVQVGAEEDAAPKKRKKSTTGAKKEDPMTTTTTTTTKANGKALATVPKKKGLAVVKEDAITVEGTEVIYTVTDLDRSLERIRVLKATAAASVWALGQELRDVREKKLWKFRLTAKGKAMYTSFDQFCEQEARLSSTHAYSLIEIAENFSEQEVGEFGTSKLTLLLKVAPEDRPALKETAKKSSKRALAKEVATVVRERGGAKKKNPKHSEAAKKGAAAKHSASASKGDKITVAAIEGRKTVKLYAKPESIRNIDWKSLRRAKTIDAQPFGKLELGNEVSMLFAIVKTDDGLDLVVNIRRES